MMKIALPGATVFVGSAILNEAGMCYRFLFSLHHLRSSVETT